MATACSHPRENAYEDGKKEKRTTMLEKMYCQAPRESLLTRGNQIKREKLAACLRFTSRNNVAESH